MSQLKSLLSITQMQAEQQLAVLQQKKQAIATLNQQLDELIDYSRSYQQSVVGTDGNLASLLVHRQQFISRLSTQIEEMAKRVSLLNDDAQACAKQWQDFEAREKAIESMVKKKDQQEEYAKGSIEQHTNDELARATATRRIDLEQQLGLDYA